MRRNPLIALSVAGLAGLIVSGCQDNRTTAAPLAYPFTTCIVPLVPLETLGGPVTIIYKNQEVKFCSNTCRDEFMKNPSRYMDKIQPPEEDNFPRGG